MGDVDWINLAEVERLFAVDWEKLRELVVNGQIDHRFIGGDKSEHIQLMKHQVARHFHVLAYPKQTTSQRRVEAAAFATAGAAIGTLISEFRRNTNVVNRDPNSTSVGLHSYRDAILRQNRPPVRPLEVEGHLFRPATDDPIPFGSSSHPSWFDEHGKRRRFFIGGFWMFVQESGIYPLRVFEHMNEAIEAMSQELGNQRASLYVEQFPITEMSFDRATRRQPLTFLQALSILYACETSLKRLGRRNSTDLIGRPEAIYRFMTVVPAIWYIDGLNYRFITEVNEWLNGDWLHFERKTGQSCEILIDISNGATVTYDIAFSIKSFFETHVNPNRLGNIQFFPGIQKLGRGNASYSIQQDFG